MSNTDQTIANTILEQLGGRRFVVMTGAKNMTFGERELNMRVGKNDKKVTHVRVALRGDDTYSMLFLNVRGHNVTEKARIDGVYADMLRRVFETETGLATSL